MKRYLVLLMVIGLVTGTLTSSAVAKKKKKKPKPPPTPAPVAIDQTYYIVWNGEGCALSLGTELASTSEACLDPFAGALGEQLGSGPFPMPALEGLPLILDASKAIKGSISTESFVLAGAGPDVMGVGEAELAVSLTGMSGGEEIVIGELVTDPYLVTPAAARYTVEFEIQPAPELQNKVFDSLTLSLELGGAQMFHGVLPADATSTLTIGAFKAP